MNLPAIQMGEMTMGWATVAKCNICGKEKGDANKWLLVDMYIAPTADRVMKDSRFTLYQWTEIKSSEAGLRFICGEECLQREMKVFLDLRSKIVAPEEGHPAHADYLAQIPQ